MLEFDENKTVFCSSQLSLSEDEISNIIVDSFEGGSTYWLGFSKADNPLFKDKPNDEPIATWSTKLLLEGYSIHLFDREDTDEKFELTLEKLKQGIKQYLTEQKEFDKDEWDADTADSIVQYALFNKIIYG